MTRSGHAMRPHPSDDRGPTSGSRESDCPPTDPTPHPASWRSVHAAAETAVADIRQFVANQNDPPSLALGSPLPGVEGFRRSHRQAQRARDVVIAAGADPASVIAASDPGFSAAALLSGDLDESRQWVHEVLGPLSSDTDNDSRMRETLRVFLRGGASYKSAADRLHLHSNSVKYRVQRAIERRGRPVGDDRLDVEIALLICQWFGPAVLLDASDT